MEMNLLGSTLRLMLGGVLGAVVGYEREVHDRPAGLRTHILVCIGSTLITLASISFYPHCESGRIAAQIVSGIGFLGAGTIIRQGSVVKGLTTAASLWTVAGIGIAVGAGGTALVLAIITTLIVFLTLGTMRRLEPIFGKGSEHLLYMESRPRDFGATLNVLRELHDMGASIKRFKNVEAETDGHRAYELTVTLPAGMDSQAIPDLLAMKADLTRLEWD